MKTATHITKLSAILLCLAMAVTLLVPVSAETAATPVSNEAELKAIVNDPAGSYVLTNNITLSADFAPLFTVSAPFTGTLDGAGYAITGLTLVNPVTTENGSAGLIVAVNGATIKNLTVAGTISNTSDKKDVRLGGFVGTANGTTFINCTNKVEISTGSTSESSFVGGFAGYAETHCTFTSCVNEASFNVINTSAANNVYVGGIVGRAAKDADIIGCTNNGKLKATSSTNVYVGGAIGLVNADASLNGFVNNGKIEVTNSNTGKNALIGGAIGTAWGAAGMVEVKNSTNNGDIVTSGKAYNGGFVGFLYATGTFENCVNFGDIQGTNGAGIVCIIGNTCPKVTIQRCVNFGDVSVAASKVGSATVASNYASGITAGTYQGCADKALVIDISHCANYGNVSTTSTSSIWISGIFSRNNNIPANGGKIEYCYNAGTISPVDTATTYIGAIASTEGATIPCRYNFSSSDNVLFGHTYNSDKTGSAVIDSTTDLAAVVATLNTGCEADAPAFRLNNGTIEAMYSLNSAPVTNYGVQETAVQDGKFAVRFLGLLNSTEFTAAGFTVSATIKQEGKADVVITEKDCKVTTVFDSLLAANEDVTIGTETVKSALGTDFFAYTITGIPANATVTFTVNAYATANGTTFTGTTYTVTYVNGVLV